MTFHRMGRAGDFCRLCDAQLTNSLKCPGCGHVDPPVRPRTWAEQAQEFQPKEML